MRMTLALAALAISTFAIASEADGPAPQSRLCRMGWCRFDQIFAGIDSSGMRVENLGALVNENPASPLAWCVFGDALDRAGAEARAMAAFDRAIELGPNMPPVLMRAANYYFTHGETDRGLRAAAVILRETDAFDPVLFSYFRLLEIPAAELLGQGIPVVPRAARSWLDWVRANGSDEQLRETWMWMKQHGLLDREAAGAALWTLWQRGSYAEARRLWVDDGGAAAEQGEPGELLVDTGFGARPEGGPFDWTLEGAPGVSLAAGGGLEVRFDGAENVAFSGVHQGVVLKPGAYRFTAEIESEGLTTDQTPLFHLFDPARPAEVHAETREIRGSMPRSLVTADLLVPGGTQALVVQLERRRSERFDNKIQGRLHVYRVSLRPLGGSARTIE